MQARKPATGWNGPCGTCRRPSCGGPPPSRLARKGKPGFSVSSSHLMAIAMRSCNHQDARTGRDRPGGGGGCRWERERHSGPCHGREPGGLNAEGTPQQGLDAVPRRRPPGKEPTGARLWCTRGSAASRRSSPPSQSPAASKLLSNLSTSPTTKLCKQAETSGRERQEVLGRANFPTSPASPARHSRHSRPPHNLEQQSVADLCRTLQCDAWRF